MGKLFLSACLLFPYNAEANEHNGSVAQGLAPLKAGRSKEAARSRNLDLFPSYEYGSVAQG